MQKNCGMRENPNTELNTKQPGTSKAKVSVNLHSTIILIFFGGQRPDGLVLDILWDPSLLQNWPSNFSDKPLFTDTSLNSLHRISLCFLSHF